ncbi:hypothetical protein [Ureaplasma canigenitalium]|uniref:hypothetical protein n=1 Tax=Ureaplasma canigenitalium TaxID=42092 RepID=UPI0004E1756F|nr:hypothetical protein [Ureaplasma canigenitalium]
MAIKLYNAEHQAYVNHKKFRANIFRVVAGISLYSVIVTPIIFVSGKNHQDDYLHRTFQSIRKDVANNQQGLLYFYLYRTVEKEPFIGHLIKNEEAFNSLISLNLKKEENIDQETANETIKHLKEQYNNQFFIDNDLIVVSFYQVPKNLFLTNFIVENKNRYSLAYLDLDSIFNNSFNYDHSLSLNPDKSNTGLRFIPVKKNNKVLTVDFHQLDQAKDLYFYNEVFYRNNKLVNLPAFKSKK